MKLIQRSSQPGQVDAGRLASFSDNVISVAITLLVFNVALPPDWRPPHPLDLWTTIGVLTPRVLSFVLTFLVIGVYWVAHNLMLTAATRVNRATLWVNNLFLLTVSLLPASAAILGNFPGQRVPVVLYGANLIAVGAALRIFWSHLIAMHGDAESAIDHELETVGKRRIWVGMFFAALGISLAWVNPWLSYAIFYISPVTFVFLQFV